MALPGFISTVALHSRTATYDLNNYIDYQSNLRDDKVFIFYTIISPVAIKWWFFTNQRWFVFCIWRTVKCNQTEKIRLPNNRFQWQKSQQFFPQLSGMVYTKQISFRNAKWSQVSFSIGVLRFRRSVTKVPFACRDIVTLTLTINIFKVQRRCRLSAELIIQFGHDPSIQRSKEKWYLPITLGLLSLWSST